MNKKLGKHSQWEEVTGWYLYFGLQPLLQVSWESPQAMVLGYGRHLYQAATAWGSFWDAIDDLA